MERKYFGSADLVDRLCSAAATNERSVTFLIGSPLSIPDHVGGHGVPGVSGMVDLIRREFEGSPAEIEFDQALEGEITNRYQRAFEFLHGRRGQDVANRIVRTAVWQALDTTNWPSFLPAASPDRVDSATCKVLEGKIDAWVLPTAVDLLGNLLVTCSDTFGSAVLTTNFDPLLEVSVLKHGGRFYRTVLHDDGHLGQTVAEGTHIVHLHGYWFGYDTLHTPQQLVQPRPRLKRSLARVLEASTLVVIGYSGWDDVITRTLVELLADSASTPEIMWAFHESDPATINASNQRLLDILQHGIGRGRVLLYRGIDCRTALSQIYDRLEPIYTAASRRTSEDPVITLVKAKRRGSRASHQVRIEIGISVPQIPSADSDSPLFVEHWVGRAEELRLLATYGGPVAFITGLGGQGKSALAGQLLQQEAATEGGRFEMWDWRDCREESDRLTTQNLRLIERLAEDTIDVAQIESTDVRAVIGVLFGILRNRRALLVFDNMDQYVDLETLEPTKGLEVLISESQSRNHNSLFVFTCRPDIRVDESRAVRVSLSGLSQDETSELIKACGVRKKDRTLATELYQTTQGHPLWVRLIAMQAVRRSDGLRGALDLIHQGGATLPDTTKTIWGTLNEQQRNVLRTMAELDRPEPKSRLLELLPGVNANRVNRALSTLRSFHLIETRAQPVGEPLLGLHPIIREFVRTGFPKKDREKYVGAILGYLDRMIGRFKPLLPKDPSFEILEHWIRKADLKITFNRFEEATSTILEIADPLINRGYSEEFVRLTMRLLHKIDWADACSLFKDFDTVFEQCLRQMIQMGHDASEELLKRYEASIPGKSTQFILLCDLRCYRDWYFADYESAIRWGEEGERLKGLSFVDTRFSTKHNLALARRDSGRISQAVESFLGGEDLQSVLKKGKRIAGKGAHFYGNIGRCLFLRGENKDATVCYVKSAQLLEESHTHRDRMNRGYIRAWIAELMVVEEKFELAAAFYRAAECMWQHSSPPRSVQARGKLKQLVARQPDLRRYFGEVDWQVEEVYSDWLRRQ